MLLVKKTVSLSNQPPLAERDLAARATDWMEALEPVVPVDRLPDAFRRALVNHATTFPINAFEIQQAFVELDGEEKTERQRIENELKKQPENKVANCPKKAWHISGDGRVMVVNPFNFNEEIELPCRDCRPEAFYEQRAKFIAEHGEIKPLEILNNFVSMADFKSNK